MIYGSDRQFPSKSRRGSRGLSICSSGHHDIRSVPLFWPGSGICYSSDGPCALRTRIETPTLLLWERTGGAASDGQQSRMIVEDRRSCFVSASLRDVGRKAVRVRVFPFSENDRHASRAITCYPNTQALRVLLWPAESLMSLGLGLGLGFSLPRRLLAHSLASYNRSISSSAATYLTPTGDSSFATDDAFAIQTPLHASVDHLTPNTSDSSVL